MKPISAATLWLTLCCFSACGGRKEEEFDAGFESDAGVVGNGDGGCTAVSVPNRSDVPYVVRGVSASDAMTQLDVYAPAGPVCGRPIVVWVHGGAWSVGDKGNQMANKVSFITGLGAVLVSINYRLTQTGNGVQHPDHVTDVAAAFAWVRSHAVELGGDPARVILLGHSAGAHLVALAATNERFLAAQGLTPAAVRCVGSYDTEYTASEIVARDSVYSTVFTNDPAVWADASPSAHVKPTPPPFQLACRGSAGRIAQCQALAASLRQAGGTVTTIDADSLSHEEVNDRIGAAGDTVMTPPVRQFLVDCFQ